MRIQNNPCNIVNNRNNNEREMDHYGLDLHSLNDSLNSGTSVAMELNSNGNMNSASSLSWADDEVENYATSKVQDCLEDLENYLVTGRLSGGDKSFDLKEGRQWRELVSRFNMQELLSDSRRVVEREKLDSHPVKQELEIQGHSFVHSHISKFGSPTPGYSQFQTPRVRSAHPIKTSSQPTRVRSAYPLSKSPALPSLRTGTRSGHANHRSLVSSTSSLPKNADYLKMVDDTARLSIQQQNAKPSSASSAAKTYAQFNKRIKLVPPSLPKFEENGGPVSSLPPLNESSTDSPAHFSNAPKSRTGKTGNGSVKFRSPSTAAIRKPASAAQQRNLLPLAKPGQFRQFYSIPPPPHSYRASNGRIGHDIEVSIVGTSLNLFEPVSRPVRPVTIPKLRNV